MADDTDEYALRAPAPRRRDTITRQLQREILGETSATQEQKTEESSPSKRRTLSPVKAAQLLKAADDAISRRDTVSPTALKAVMRAAEEAQTETRENSEQEAKKTSPVKAAEDRKSASIGNTSDSFTDTMFAPNLLEQDAGRRATLDPTEAASVVMALQKEARSLSTSALEMDSSTESDNEPTDSMRKSSPSKTRSKTLTPLKESNKSPPKNKKSPTPSKENSRKPTPSKETKSSKSQSPAKVAKSRKSSSPAKNKNSPSPVKETKSNKASTPTKTSAERRTTIDPSDALMMLEGSSQQEDDRRQTIDENGLLELTSGRKSLGGGGKESARKRREEASRKRVNDSDARGGTPEKRARSDGGNNGDHTMESMELDSPEQPVAKSGPTAKSQPKTDSSNQRSPNNLHPSRIPNPSIFSPPPGGTRIRTPLKGILSARKGPRNTRDAVQTTPNKSVNFGPSQGAEFNHGSPSTSMTPMLAKDASRLFPLERAPSEEEPDDAETSLNSSILDEADSLDEEEPKKVSVPKVTQLKKSGFDLLQSRRSSLMAPKSTDKKNRRHSMRGYSPLDARAEIRRRRRQTINVTRQTSKSASATTSLTATEKPTTNSQSPSTTRSNSFLRATDVQQTNRMRYADSSESSDTGEDMEITGDYSATLEAAGNKAASSTGLPRDEDTAEFSLGHLLAESSMYELTKSTPEPDLHDLPGSLSDLANEAASAHSNQGSQVANATQSSHDQNAALDPIEEANETMTSSRNQSAMSMSLVSEDSDDEDVANRKSLQVNLKSQFDRVSEPSQSPQRPPTPEAPSVSLITMEELLSSVALNEDNALVEMGDAFFGEEAESSDNQTSKNVKLACSTDRCSEVIERHTQEISSWSLNMAQELSSLLLIKAPAIFSPENLDDAGREAIQELYATEAMVARTGWCQLQAQIEQQLTNSLSRGADELAIDVKSLKDSVAGDVLKRKNELAAIKEMIDREEQMALLLDAIEEQQGAHDEYVAAVENLEKECSSLSLEESVLQSRLKVLEGRAAELEPVTSAAASLFEQEVLETEEMLAIQESMSVWEIREATASLLRVSARFEDVLFDVEICVDVHLGSSTTGGASTSIKTNESLKRREGNTYLPYEGDVVLVLQRLLLNPHYISQIAEESELGAENDGRVCSKLQVLERFISRSFRLLRELRELSTHFAMHYDEDDSTLWVDFLKFPSVAARIDVEGAEFSVGFSLLPIFPFTDYQTAVRVPRGQVSIDDVTREVKLVSRQEPKYFTRVCRRLHETFVR